MLFTLEYISDQQIFIVKVDVHELKFTKSKLTNSMKSTLTFVWDKHEVFFFRKIYVSS